MRIFLYEYTCATPARADSLHNEGQAMFSAVLEDFGRIDGVEILTIEAHVTDEEQVFRKLVKKADFTLVIAPEFDDLLFHRVRWVEEEGGRLFGPDSRAVKLTADKLELGRFLKTKKVPTPECHLWQTDSSVPDGYFPAVLKPCYGAGSRATFFVRAPGDLPNIARQARQEEPGAKFLLQSFVPGMAASVAFLIGPNQVVPLLPASQELSQDGRFRYQGGAIPLAPDLSRRAVRLATQAINAVPGLSGYVGVDLVLGAASDGSRDFAIEINPRLTTSYVGLQALAESNLAEAMIQLIKGERETCIRWRPGTVRFRADGQIVYS